MTKRIFASCLAAVAALLRGADPVRLDLGQGTVVRFVTPAPALLGAQPQPDPEFDGQGKALVQGLELERVIAPIAGGYAVTLSMTNRRNQPVELVALTPLRIDGPDGLKVAGTTVEDWTIYRIARHKNDIPGPFRPTVVDDASKDAAVDNSEGGKTDDPLEARTPGVRFHSDPGFVVMADGRPESTHLFLGFAGQTEHLNDLTLELDPRRTRLTRIAARAEFDGVVVAPGETRRTHAFYLQSGQRCQDLLAAHVQRIRQMYGSRLSSLRNVFCTWYFYGPEIVADDLRADLATLRRRPVAFDSFLIDYGWSRRFGDWTADPARFPQGMKEMADEIRAAGLVPGIWTAPFIAAPDSEALRHHPDLILRERSGRPVSFRMADMGDFYAVDPTAPSAPAFIGELCRRLRGWGYGYLKFDFLRAVVNDPNAIFHDRKADRATAYRRGMELLRAGAGPNVTIGAWGGLYEANAGIVNINRSGSDVRGHWDPVDGYKYGTRYPVRMRQTFARSFYDDRLFTSDQDALQLRRRTTAWRTAKPHLAMGMFTDEEAFSLVLYRFLGGGVVQVSEKLDALDEDRFRLYREAIPTYAPVAEVFDGWTGYLPEHFVSHFAGHAGLPAWAVVSLCNWNGKAPKDLDFRVSDVPGLPPANAYAAFEFRTQRFLGVVHARDEVRLSLPPHAARAIRLTPLAAAGTYLIGTDLNLAQGMELSRVDGQKAALDVRERPYTARCTFLTWKNGAALILSGTAAVPD